MLKPQVDQAVCCRFFSSPTISVIAIEPAMALADFTIRQI